MFAWERLEVVNARLEEWISEVANRRSPLEWSGILRRFGHELYGQIPQVADGVLYISSSNTRASHMPDKWIRFRTQGWFSGPSVLADLEDLISLAVLSFNVGSDQRRIGKGQSLILGKQLFPIQVNGDPGVGAAIDLYDSRLANEIGESSGATTGSSGADIATRADIDRRGITDMVITWMDLRNHKLLSPTDQTQLLSRYDPIFPVAIDIRTLAPTLVFPDSITRETIALVAVLQVAWQWLQSRKAQFATKRGIWTQYGYLDCSKSWFLKELRENQSPIAASNIEMNVQEVLEILKPLSLSVIYPVGSRVVVDLLHASHLLDSTIFRAQEGSNANAWGSAFETAVQNLIDTTPWRPPDTLRPLIGRVIRSGRNAITDIDAVALAGETLLLIDVKAFRKNPRLARGEYSAIRTMQERVEAASVRWRDIIGLIRGNPEMLRIPIPDGIKIDGLIVLPFVPYVSIGVATEPVLSLRRASSLAELLPATQR